MNSNVIYPHGKKVSIAVAASDVIAVKSIGGDVNVFEIVTDPNVPNQRRLLQTVSNSEWTSSAFSSAATVEIEAGEAKVYYSVGTEAKNLVEGGAEIQPDPQALNATGTLTADIILDKVVTSTTTAAVTATLDTGAAMDAASSFDVNDSFDWTVINTGTSNAITVTASSAHTIVGAGAVDHTTSGRFRTRKTATDTFVTYRLA